MASADIPAGLRLCRAAGWNQIERDWRLFLDLGRAFVIEVGGEIAGSVATIRYGKDLAWISMLLVDPVHRGGGMGRALLEIALKDLQDVGCVKLDATPEGRRIYQRYGFADEFRAWRMAGTGGAIQAKLSSVESVRHPIEAANLRDAPEYAWKMDPQNYILGRHGFIADHLGPVIASDFSTAQRLVEHVLALHPEKMFFLDVPEPADWAREIGFTERREFVRMAKGGCASHPPPFAIIGPEFG